MTQKQREDRTVRFIIFGNFIATLAGIWVFLATDIQALFLDAFYSAVALLSSIVAFIMARASKLRTKHYPDGLHFLEPLYATLKSLLMLTLLVYSVYSVTATAWAYWTQGIGEPLTIGPVIPYAIAMTVQCFFFAFYIHRQNKKINFTSTILTAESKTCYVDGLQSFGIGAATFALYFIDINGKLGFLHYIGDFLITIVLVLFSIKEPVAVLVNSFRELTGGTSSDKELVTSVHKSIQKHCPELLLKQTKVIKRGMYITAYLYLTATVEYERANEIRKNLMNDLSQKYENLEIIFCQ